MDNDKKLWDYHQTINAENLIMGNPRQDILFKKIKKIFKKGKILEIGFGNGYLLKKLSNQFDCYGADISYENIEQMKKVIPEVKFNLIDVDGKLPYKKDFFDVFIASEVLEHMTNDELDLNIKEIYRVLKKGGYAIITFPVNEKLKDNECFCSNCGEIFHKWGHKQTWNIKKIKSKFKDFEITEVKEFFTPFKSNNYFENLIGLIMFLMRNFLNIFLSIPNKNYLLIIKK